MADRLSDRDRDALEIMLRAIETAVASIDDEEWRGSLSRIASLFQEALPDHESRDPDDPVALALIPVLRGYNVGPDGPVTNALRIGRYTASSRARCELIGHGIDTLLDAAHHTREELAATPGVGRKSLDGIERALRDRGMAFATDRQEA